MDYTRSVSDIEHRELLAQASATVATLAGLVERQPTLSPAEREAVHTLFEAPSNVRERLTPQK